MKRAKCQSYLIEMTFPFVISIKSFPLSLKTAFGVPAAAHTSSKCGAPFGLDRI